MPRIVILGEALIDVFAEPGVSLREAQALRPVPGGAPANGAVALARLGADVGFIGKVGDDDFGALLIDLLHGEGVDTTYFEADPAGPTMLAIVASPSPTEQRFILYNGANGLLSVAALPREYITSAAVLAHGGVTLASASREAALQAARWAWEKQRIVVFDVNLRPALWPDLSAARHVFQEAIAFATVVKVNDAELEFLTGTRDPREGCQALMAQGPQLCCVSLGARGSYYSNGAYAGIVPPFPVDVRDTTGSGDAFVAGLAYQLARLERPPGDLDGRQLREIMRFANACGGLAATAVGGMSASPTLSAVEALLASHP